MKLNKSGEWMDASGKYVDPKYISQHVKSEDRDVAKLQKKAVTISKQLSDLLLATEKMFLNHLERLAKEYAVPPVSGKGNMTMRTFDGTQSVKCKVYQRIVFDARLNTAKELVDKCISKWAQGADQKLKAIVSDAFKVDKEGAVDPKALLRLKKLKIDDADWRIAMKMGDDSMTLVSSKKHYQFFIRETPEAEWKTINLSFGRSVSGVVNNG